MSRVPYPVPRDALNIVNGYAERMYARYAEVRPHAAAPSRAQDLLPDGAAVERKHFLHLLPTRRAAAVGASSAGPGSIAVRPYPCP